MKVYLAKDHPTLADQNAIDAGILQMHGWLVEHPALIEDAGLLPVTYHQLRHLRATQHVHRPIPPYGSKQRQEWERDAAACRENYDMYKRLREVYTEAMDKERRAELERLAAEPNWIPFLGWAFLFLLGLLFVCCLLYNAHVNATATTPQ